VILLDTNIVSETMRDAPSPAVVAWFDGEQALDLFIPSLVLAEIHFGIAKLAPGARRGQLERAVAELADELYRGRIVNFDERAASAYGAVSSRRRASGRPISQMDALIASVTIANGAALATRNTRDFAGLGISLVNPFEHRP
jgi:hypothetical protein